ncbi:MAG: glycosyltransferase family 2 protein [Planctomycetes bacterium]|nr:glycosyltransferase family 2 protein [Planctomycetota bacterium]
MNPANPKSPEQEANQRVRQHAYDIVAAEFRSLGAAGPLPQSAPTVAAVMVSFNKREFVRKNLAGIHRQTIPFATVIVVDNASSDGSAAMIRELWPTVHLIEMPHSKFGACETFNIGFKLATTDFIAILDDDVVLPDDWVERMLEKAASEPPTTAMISSKVHEPEEPAWYTNHPEVNRERYMATFRGCATLARRDVLEACGYYDEAFFIYGNERDLAARVLLQGCRILQYPGVVVEHGTPFGMKAGKRSLYYHIRNMWWYFFKHVGLWQIIWFIAMQVLLKLRFRREEIKADAIGSIGIYRVIGETPGGWWVVVRATWDAFVGLPRCLRQRRVCTHPDFSLPSK